METYFTLFKLILEGKLGHAAQLAAAKEEKAGLPGKKGSKSSGKGAKSKGSLPTGKAQRPPSSIEQVTRLWRCLSQVVPAGICLPFSTAPWSCGHLYSSQAGPLQSTYTCRDKSRPPPAAYCRPP